MLHTEIRAHRYVYLGIKLAMSICKLDHGVGVKCTLLAVDGEHKIHLLPAWRASSEEKHACDMLTKRALELTAIIDVHIKSLLTKMTSEEPIPIEECEAILQKSIP